MLKITFLVLFSAMNFFTYLANADTASELIEKAGVRSIKCTPIDINKKPVYLPTEVVTDLGNPKTSTNNSPNFPFLPLKIEYGKDGKITKFTDGYGCKHQDDGNGNLKRIFDRSEGLQSRCRILAVNPNDARNSYDVFPKIKKERFFKLLNSICKMDHELDQFNEKVKTYVEAEKIRKAQVKDKLNRHGELLKGIK